MSSPAQAASQAVRKMLRDLGSDYDIARSLKPFSDNKSIYDLLDYFHYECCYCGENLTDKQWDKDHLIPMNKDSAGLHSWGNIVPSCKSCNNKRQNKDWRVFLESLGLDESILNNRKLLIENYIKKYNYNISDEKAKQLSMLANKLQSEVALFVKQKISELYTYGTMMIYNDYL